MTFIVVILWILYKLQAPVWCYVVIGISLCIRIYYFCKGLYKLGAKHGAGGL